MKILKINGTGSIEDKGFGAEVVFPSENKYDVTLQAPFREPDDIDGNRGERLRWYFEDHLASPYTERGKAKRAADSIPAYGETLFSQVFADPDEGVRFEGTDGTDNRVVLPDVESKALHQVLDNEGDFYPLYNVIAFFYHLQPLPTEAIEFMEAVVKKLELFSEKDQTFQARLAGS